MYHVQYQDLERAVLRLEENASGCNETGIERSIAEYHAALNRSLKNTQAILFSISYMFDLMLILGILFLVVYTFLYKEKITIRSIMNEIERERTRISMELHDSVIQDIKLADRLAGQMTDRISDEQKTELKSVLNHAQSDARGICFSLNPLGIDLSDLSLTLRQFCMDANNKGGINVECYIDDNSVFSGLKKEDKVNVFRIVQETVNNAILHSGASTVNISARKSAKMGFVLFISDDGSGFDVGRDSDEAEKNGHFGLANIKQRVRLMNGSLKIISSPESGTTVRIEV